MSVFSDTTNKLGLIQGCERQCNLGDTGISGDDQRLKEFTAFINEGQRKIWGWIFSVYSGWVYDDKNQTDLPQATCDMVNGTGKYSLPTKALTIKKVSVKNSSGNWYDLSPFTLEDLKGTPLPEWHDVNSTPNYYRLVGNTIELKPAPNYDSTAGLKVYFDREGVDFASTDTTDTPGFASIFHELLSVYGSIQWLKIKEPESGTLKILMNEWQRGEIDIKEFYKRNWQDKRLKITRRKEVFK